MMLQQLLLRICPRDVVNHIMSYEEDLDFHAWYIYLDRDVKGKVTDRRIYAISDQALLAILLTMSFSERGTMSEFSVNVCSYPLSQVSTVERRYDTKPHDGFFDTSSDVVTTMHFTAVSSIPRLDFPRPPDDPQEYRTFCRHLIRINQH